MFVGDAEGVSDASAARQGGTGQNSKATAEGSRSGGVKRPKSGSRSHQNYFINFLQPE